VAVTERLKLLTQMSSPKADPHTEFMGRMAQMMRKKFGKPYYGIVADLTSTLFNVNVSDETVRSAERKRKTGPFAEFITAEAIVAVALSKGEQYLGAFATVEATSTAVETAHAAARKAADAAAAAGKTADASVAAAVDFKTIKAARAAVEIGVAAVAHGWAAKDAFDTALRTAEAAVAALKEIRKVVVDDFRTAVDVLGATVTTAEAKAAVEIALPAATVALLDFTETGPSDPLKSAG
jgi:hypothetical protein